MVLELLINPKKLQGKKWEIFFLGAFYAFVAIILSLWIFKGHASLVMITFTVIVSIPFIHRIIEMEEKKDLEIIETKNLLKEHSNAIVLLVFLFLGFLFTFSATYLVLPQGMVQNIFQIQLDTILALNSGSPTGSFINGFVPLFEIIFNNLKILMFCIIFSFFFGAGAIFILTWNASVMATAIGSFIKLNIAQATGLGMFQLTLLAIVRYATHGIMEVVAYFVAALASGIIALALMQHELDSDHFKIMLGDALGLVIISFLLIIVAGLVEVFITPLLIF